MTVSNNCVTCTAFTFHPLMCASHFQAQRLVMASEQVVLQEDLEWEPPWEINNETAVWAALPDTSLQWYCSGPENPVSNNIKDGAEAACPWTTCWVPLVKGTLEMGALNPATSLVTCLLPSPVR